MRQRFWRMNDPTSTSANANATAAICLNNATFHFASSTSHKRSQLSAVWANSIWHGVENNNEPWLFCLTVGCLRLTLNWTLFNISAWWDSTSFKVRTLLTSFNFIKKIAGLRTPSRHKTTLAFNIEFKIVDCLAPQQYSMLGGFNVKKLNLYKKKKQHIYSLLKIEFWL